MKSSRIEYQFFTMKNSITGETKKVKVGKEPVKLADMLDRLKKECNGDEHWMIERAWIGEDTDGKQT